MKPAGHSLARLFPCAILLASWWFAAGSAAASLEVKKSVFGQMPDGTSVDLYTLTNSHGLEVKVMTYGATILSVKTPDRHGTFDNVTLCLDGFDDYLKGHPLFGSVVGRYANRIAGAKFVLDGAEYRITANAGQNHIHGGRTGFQKIVWQARPIHEKQAVGVELSHSSPDGHEGYPGKLDVKVVYKLTEDNELIMRYVARTDKPTHVNLTNHAYWNLAGAGSGDVLDHVLMLHADEYLPANEQKIPTGKPRRVEGTVMDFTKPKTIGSRIDQVEGKNYDHCYVLNKKPGKPLALAARVVELKSGRVMEVFTTQPGVQIYTAKHLSNRLQAGGVPYGPYHGVCLETQHYPDSPNRPEFPSTVLRPGETYERVTIHRFSVGTEPDASQFKITTRKQADRVQVAAEGDKTVFTVTSVSGIGGAVIGRAGDRWPRTIVLRIRLRGLEKLTVSSGTINLSATVLSHSGNKQIVHLWKGERKDPQPAGDGHVPMEIKVFNSKGSPIAGLPDKGGYFEMTLPKTLFEENPESITLSWIDFYRT